MSWLDRLKGKGGGPDDPDTPADAPQDRSSPDRAQSRPSHVHPPMPRLQRASERRPVSETEVDLDALLGDIASGLAPARPAAPEPRSEPDLPRRPRLGERMREDNPFAPVSEPEPQAPELPAPQPAAREPEAPAVELKFEEIVFARAPAAPADEPPAVEAPAPHAYAEPAPPVAAPEAAPPDFAQTYAAEAPYATGSYVEPTFTEPTFTEPAFVEEAPEEPVAEARTPEELMAEALAAATAGQYEAALNIWEPLARAGNARAQNNIGACFVDGLGVDQDLDLARRWLELAAEGGDPVGRRNLATLYFKGQGVEQDYARAADLYRAAAEDGDAPAQDMLS